MMDLHTMSKDDLSLAIKEFASATIDNYTEASAVSEQDKFQAGRQLAYFEVLDMLRSRIELHGGSMEEIKLPV